MYLSTSASNIPTIPAFRAPMLTRLATSLTLGNAISISRGDSQLQRWSSIIGIVTAIVGNILISFALNIQRYAHIRLGEERFQRKEKIRNAAKSSQNGYGTAGTNGNHFAANHEQGGGAEDDALGQTFHSSDSQSSSCSDDDHNQESTYLKSPYWWGGIILMTVGEAGNFLAYGFAPASIVSPLGVVALVSNCVIAPIMLKENFRLRDFWGVVVAVVGACTVVLSAKQQEKKLGPHEILGAITTTEFEVYVAITTFLIVVFMWASPRYGNKTILIDLGLVGLFGGYTALSTKGVASMLSSTLWRALATPITYGLLAVLVGTAVMQVKYVNKALQRFDSTQVIPVQFVMFTLSVIIGSAVLYRDFEKATAGNVGKFIGGCLLTFFGVFLITSGRPQQGDEEEEEVSDGEGELLVHFADQESRAEENQYQHGPNKSATVGSGSTTDGVPNGDSANDDGPISESRSTSSVGLADPLAKPRTHSISAYQPRPPPTILAPSSEYSLGTEDTPLLSNPWKNSVDSLLQASRHPGMQSITSTPVLSSEAQFTDSWDPSTRRLSTQSIPPTHSSLQQAERPLTPRHSISRIMPGPLLSPLSGGLSAVVADSLRRGVDGRSKSFKRPRYGSQRTKSVSQRFLHAQDITDDELGTSPKKNGDIGRDVSKSLGTETPDWSRLTRTRSLSNTLSDLFRGKRQRIERSDAVGDDEAGPSGS